MAPHCRRRSGEGRAEVMDARAAETYPRAEQDRGAEGEAGV